MPVLHCLFERHSCLMCHISHANGQGQMAAEATTTTRRKKKNSISTESIDLTRHDLVVCVGVRAPHRAENFSFFSSSVRRQNWNWKLGHQTKRRGCTDEETRARDVWLFAFCPGSCRRCPCFFQLGDFIIEAHVPAAIFLYIQPNACVLGPYVCDGG